MSKLTLNKTTLKKERDNLKLFQQYLPSLDLKRQQFLLELKEAKRDVSSLLEEISRMRENAAAWISLLGNMEISVHDLVKVTRLSWREENLLGIRLPLLEHIEIARPPYSYLVKPHWVDVLTDTLEELARLNVRLQIAREREIRLKAALKTITQRVNLFDKVLIPGARENIRKINIFLSDSERAAVIRAKIAKAKGRG